MQPRGQVARSSLCILTSFPVVSGFYGCLFLVLGHWAQGESRNAISPWWRVMGAWEKQSRDIPVWSPCTAGVGFRGSSLSLPSSLQNTRLTCSSSLDIWVENCPQLHSPLHACPHCPLRAPSCTQSHSTHQALMRMCWDGGGVSLLPHLTPAASAPPRASSVWQFCDLATPAAPGLSSTGKHVPLGLRKIGPRRSDAGPFCQCLLHLAQCGKAPLTGTYWGASMQHKASPNHLWGHCLCHSSILHPAPAELRVRKW